MSGYCCVPHIFLSTFNFTLFTFIYIITSFIFCVIIVLFLEYDLKCREFLSSVSIIFVAKVQFHFEISTYHKFGSISVAPFS